ncbi:MAG: hypothetical protein IJZ79_03415 [Bacilli bacterium]|nr:hypothetical protein [Bacilli bacterium]MBQ8218777.1 hypothetical protein [Bacilli bacterium]
MAENTVLYGQYGYYYPYKDETGRHGLKILDEIYEKFYRPGYLTDNHLQAMLSGATITFRVPNKSGNGDQEIRARLVPYTSKAGKECKIIEFESDQLDDDKIIIQNGEKIVTSYWDGTRFNYMKPQAIIDTLNLMHIWRTWSEYNTFDDIKLGTVKVYKSNSRGKSFVLLYCKVENDKCEMISEEQFKALKAEADAKQEEKRAKLQAESDKCNEVRKQLLEWLNSIVNQIWPNDICSVDEIIANTESIIVNVNVPDLESRVAALLSSKSFAMNIPKYIENTKQDIKYNITVNNYSNPDIAENIKTKLLNNLKTYVHYLAIHKVRLDLLDEYKKSGLDAMTESINVDEALNLGYFPMVQKALVKYKQEAPKYIINNMYLDIIDPDDLKTKLLNLLKIYYDFYDMPEKDRKSIAKYIAQNKLSDYYERISAFDDVLEILIGESRDPKLSKPLLESIAGTSRANCLKDKTFYFEKTGRLKSEIYVYKPIELLDRLRTLIKEFNSSSDVAILTNIELDADESFIFQFYTFAGDSNAERDFDGRRMLNLTRIYNRHYPNEKIGFTFDNDSN